MSRVNVAPFAWAGWRLRLPGGPEGGQYHGFLGLSEADAPDGIHRGPAEVRPERRANLVHAPFRRSPRGFGMLAPDEDNIIGGGSGYMAMPTPAIVPHLIPPVFWQPGPSRTGEESIPEVPWPMFAPPIIGSPITADGSGATSIVAQPAPVDSPAPNQNVVAYVAPPVSPAPSPTVAAGPSNFLPAFSTPAVVSVVPSSVSSWLQEQSLISGYPNWEVALGAVALFWFFAKKGKR